MIFFICNQRLFMNIYITLDYELFLGPKTGSVENCLITPTYNLCKVVEKYNVKMVFFIDVLYLLKLEQYSNINHKLQEDYNKIIKQLKFLHKEGHDIQLHIHPQWYYSTYDMLEKCWKLDFKHYSISDCLFDDVKEMFINGCKFIYDIIGTYPTAYRAGGYSFMNSKQFIDFLTSLGIVKDSSVIMGEKSNSLFQKYDYSNVRNSSIYNFSNDVVTPDSNGIMTEYPITTIKTKLIIRSLVNRFIRYRYGKLVRRNGDGIGVGAINLNKPKNNILSNITLRASIDLINAFWLKYIYRKLRKKGENTMVIIGHPKNISNYSFIALDKFLGVVNEDDLIKTFK